MSDLRPAGKSISAVDNTENIWTTLRPGDSYELRVVVPDKQADFNKFRNMKITITMDE